MASEDFSYESSYFVSAPTSPQRLSTDSVLSFYSVPPSPTQRQNLDPNGGPDYDQDFEFDVSRYCLDGIGGDGFITSRNFESPAVQENKKKKKKKKQRVHRCTESLPTTSFADELFCDGKLKMILPLKPPPGSRNPCAGISPPRSPRSPFGRRSNLWNDDFDPFEAALESVKEDKKAGNSKNHRRARSMSPFGGIHRRSSEPPLEQGPVLYSPWSPNQRKESDTTEPKSPAQKKLAEPRGLDFARRLRLVKAMTQNNGNKKNGDGDDDEGDANGRETKRQRIMRFLMKRSRSLDSEEKNGRRESERDFHNSNRRRSGVLRRLSFNSNRSSGTEVEKKVASPSATTNRSRAVAKVTVRQYTPRLFLCLGYGLRSSRHVK